MSKKDATESDWTKFFTQRFGSQITRRNVAIYTPIVQNMTIPIVQYNNGTINPPKVVRDYNHVHPSAEALRNEDISNYQSIKSAYSTIDTNPNFAGDGKYFPEYHKHGVLFDYPEWKPTTNTRLQAPAPRKEIPLEIRRKLY